MEFDMSVSSSFENTNSQLTFSCCESPLSVPMSSPLPKLSDFESLSDNEVAQLYKGLNKSNYLKNIAHSFTSFICEYGDEVIITSLMNSQVEKTLFQIRREFVQFMKQKALNQSSLIAVLRSQRFGEIFNYFLCFYAEEWLQQSQIIKDLKGHLICIEFLTRSKNQTELLSDLKIYTKNKQVISKKRTKPCSLRTGSRLMQQNY